MDLGVPLRLEGRPDFVRAEVGGDRHRKAHNRPPPWGDFPVTFRVLTERDQLLGRPLRRVASHHGRALTTMQGGGAGKEQFEMIIDLRHRPHGGAGRAHRIGLIDCNRRRYALNAVDLGLVHAVEELARIGRECLDIAALPLGIQGVEDQRRFTRTRHARHDDQLVRWQVDVDVLEIVLPSSADPDHGLRPRSSVSVQP